MPVVVARPGASWFQTVQFLDKHLEVAADARSAFWGQSL